MKILLTAILTLFFVGCASTNERSLYCWQGEYPSSVYSYLLDDYDLTEQISKLENLANEATQQSRKVPPGLYAHIGLLYSNKGDLAVAKAYFEKEMSEFGESKEFLEFLLKAKK
ncbi:DUF4810 domain-containing protein [Campylobacter gastrosuis]|uniref:DUF4810 domain-containing protein n=1 Tax=Campylobacter gastrosuis TaxID=2974576 RepID=A0ABT7HN65_9BACT|nr:DUF4810 domain-containing protein [Campylobacter gastrosuis]MDL0088349.1 DUF4810 domain-containing protein [Campylobacter gastrosuis]